MIEYNLKGILSNWRQWNWKISNYPMREEEANVIVSALQELTRCNNCKHWERKFGTDIGFCPILDQTISSDGYCSLALKREEDL